VRAAPALPLNFLQHVFTILKQHGRAAVVVPDNVLFEGGAGEIVRRALLKQADVHTLLRLPTGIFYAQRVKANVDSSRPLVRLPPSASPCPCRTASRGLHSLLRPEARPGKAVECEPHLHLKLWIYDLRTNLHFTLKENTLKRSDLDDFVNCYFGGAPSDAVESAVSADGKKISAGDSQRYSGNRHDRKPTWTEKNEKGRWRAYKYEDLIKRHKINLDIFWLKDEALEDSSNLPAPEIIATEIVEDLQAALAQFSEIAEDLKK
jgi:type I restriction enzyme M protein